jgi:hypothetical protein
MIAIGTVSQKTFSKAKHPKEEVETQFEIYSLSTPFSLFGAMFDIR